jgi:hypothetical protein
MSEIEIADAIIIMVDALMILVLILIVGLFVWVKIWTVRTHQPWLSAKDAAWYALSGMGLTIAFLLFIFLMHPTITQVIAGFCGYLFLGYLVALHFRRRYRGRT